MHIGDEVGWKWGNSIATGLIQDIVPAKASIVSRGKTIVRNGTSEDPAVIITHHSGNLVIKRAHELTPINHSTS